MKSRLFPLNFIKVQRPPVVRMKTRGDGAMIIQPIDPSVTASTDTGMSTNLVTGSASYATSTGNDTASATTLSTQTASAVNAASGEPNRYVVSSTTQRVSVKPGPQPDPSNMDFAVDPKQLMTVVDETGAPIRGLSNGRITRVYFRDGPRPDGAITIDPIGTEPALGPAGLLTIGDGDANDADDDDHQLDIDNIDDDDNWEDSTPDDDSIAAEGILVPLPKGAFKPPLAPRGTRGKRRRS